MKKVELSEYCLKSGDKVTFDVSARTVSICRPNEDLEKVITATNNGDDKQWIPESVGELNQDKMAIMVFGMMISAGLQIDLPLKIIEVSRTEHSKIFIFVV